jgi:hypothetical protein
MSDLVERLRNKDWLWSVPGALREEAADEIDRLRAALETIREAIVHRRSVSGHIDYKPLRDFVEEALNGTAEG